MCEAGCMFCRDCVRRGSEVQIADSKSIISCLISCGENIPLPVLQTVLPALMFSKLVQRRQMEEVQAAGLKDLVQCPACSFATIMSDPEDKVIVCGNQECGKMTCRICGEESHVPLPCDEVAKDGEVVARSKLEDAMTEAMVRACVRCKKRFFKDEGCNKMKCECGQSMCYLCRQPVDNNYKYWRTPTGVSLSCLRTQEP
jgi:TRIAD3 protein (E3 ubiquitin-protein ligase RNF216)